MARTFEVKKAEQGNTYVRIALVGSAGSGKTYSALRLATGMGGKIVVLDTENLRSQKYAKKFDFHRIDFQPPFNPSAYSDAIDEAIKQGAKTIIIDSMSHEHEGEGGLLEMAEAFLQKRAGDDYKKRDNLKFASWIEPKRERTQLILKIQRLPVNIILCFRAKEVTKPVRNAQGKIEPIKEWDMIGGDEYRYEMDVTAFLPSGSEGVPDWNNSMRRINDADGTLKRFLVNAGQLSEEIGRQIKAMNTVAPTQTAATATPSTTTASVATQNTTATTVEEATPTAETNEQRIKRMAGQICQKIKEAKDLGDLDFVMMDFKDDLEEIKTASIVAHSYVITEKEKKQKALEMA